MKEIVLCIAYCVVSIAYCFILFLRNTHDAIHNTHQAKQFYDLKKCYKVTQIRLKGVMLSTVLFLLATKKKRLIVFGAIRRFYIEFLLKILRGYPKY
jgi:hypothetical protein